MRHGDYRIEDEPVVTVEEEIEHIVDWIKHYFVRNGADSKAVIGISGGKDSTIAAALCVEALGKDRVVGVLMPQGIQADIEDARKVCKELGILSVEINIGEVCDVFYKHMEDDSFGEILKTPQITTNTPARIRMTTLYAVAAAVGGRVCNTCNRSENYVGYSTKFGDHAGDFSPLGGYTVREVLEIGDALGLPYDLVHKTPNDGMCGESDEEKLGFSYETLDAYILDGVVPEYNVFKLIEQAYEKNKHKNHYMPICRSLNPPRNFSFY